MSSWKARIYVNSRALSSAPARIKPDRPHHRSARPHRRSALRRWECGNCRPASGTDRHSRSVVNRTGGASHGRVWHRSDRHFSWRGHRRWHHCPDPSMTSNRASARSGSRRMTSCPTWREASSSAGRNGPSRKAASAGATARR